MGQFGSARGLLDRTLPWKFSYARKLPDFYPVWYPIEFLKQDAPAIPLTPPLAELVDKSSDGATRTLRLHITTPRHARTIYVGLPQSEVVSASVDGHDLGKPSEARWHGTGQWSFNYANPPAEGIDVELHVRGSEPVTLVLVDCSSGLPTIPGANYLRAPPIPCLSTRATRRWFAGVLFFNWRDCILLVCLCVAGSHCVLSDMWKNVRPSGSVQRKARRSARCVAAESAKSRLIVLRIVPT